MHEYCLHHLFFCPFYGLSHAMVVTLLVLQLARAFSEIVPKNTWNSTRPINIHEIGIFIYFHVSHDVEENINHPSILHPGRLTWNIIMEVWKIIFLSKWLITRFHVNLPGCREKKTFPVNHRSSSGTKLLSGTIQVIGFNVCRTWRR